MRFSCDQFGFPLITLDDPRVTFAVLPFSKWQFEQLLMKAEPKIAHRFNDYWYDELLRSNQRVSCHRLNNQNLLNAWLTGLSPSDASRIAACVAGRLPSAEEWLSTERALLESPVSTENVEQLMSLPLNDVAKVIFKLLLSKRPESQNWAALSLFQGGVFEWVRWNITIWNKNPTGYGALGVPPNSVIVSQRDGPRYYAESEQPSHWHGFRIYFGQ